MYEEEIWDSGKIAMLRQISRINCILVAMRLTHNICSCQGSDCQPFQAIMCAKWQQDQIKKLKPVALCLDATGQLNRYGFQTFTLLTYDDYGM